MSRKPGSSIRRGCRWSRPHIRHRNSRSPEACSTHRSKSIPRRCRSRANRRRFCPLRNRNRGLLAPRPDRPGYRHRRCRPADRLVDPPADRRVDPPEDQRVDQPADRRVDQPADQPADRLVDQQVDRPADQRVDRLADRQVDQLLVDLRPPHTSGWRPPMQRHRSDLRPSLSICGGAMPPRQTNVSARRNVYRPFECALPA